VPEDNARLYRDVQENNRRKNEFLAMLAHELRNPLAPIRNAAEIIRMLNIPDPNLEWAGDVISRQVEQLIRLVDDLLDISRITGGKIQLRKEPLDVAVAVARAVETSRPLIDSRRHALSVDLPPYPLLVEGDLVRLSQILSNLLNNAAKYTEEGGRISLDVTHDAAEAVFRVRDNGIGIDPDMVPCIFELFTQVDRSLDRSQGGLGVGLTLVRQLVEMHGGTVQVYSDGPNRGSEFVVRLPAKAPAIKPTDPAGLTLSVANCRYPGGA
jgi:signal transduction histidine kinase